VAYDEDDVRDHRGLPHGQDRWGESAPSAAELARLALWRRVQVLPAWMRAVELRVWGGPGGGT
jgi:hypothetical protein